MKINSYLGCGAIAVATLAISACNGQDVNNSIAVGDFEFDNIPVVRNESGVDRYLWEAVQHSSGGDFRPGYLSLNTEDPLYGAQDLKFTSTSAGPDETGMFVRYYNNWTDTSTNNWRYVRETVGYTDLNTYNRMRVWVKLPSSTIKSSRVGNTNFHIGTYLRNGDTSTHKSESDNWHFYHYYNLEYTNNWQQIIVDPHPNHQRGASGSTEHGVIIEPDVASSPGHNYFDLMTYFYFNLKHYSHSGGGEFNFDNVELYEEPYDEDIDHIYSLTGVLSKVTDEIIVYWKRDKTEDTKTFDVKYSFTSFYDNGGWSHGDIAPNGKGLEPPNTGGYNGVEWRSDQIDIAGKDAIYIAIKHQDETSRFRQIRIPLTAEGYPSFVEQIK